MGRFSLWIVLSAVAALTCPALPSATSGEIDSEGFVVHELSSPYQSGNTRIRVLLPEQLDATKKHRVIYVLPVEAGQEKRYGDGLLEIKRLGLHQVHGVIFVAPSLSQLPWYADHPSELLVRQESHFVRVVVPFVDAHYPTKAEASGRMLLGFSKSGWGAWALLLRHPDDFGRAAAWDSPLVTMAPGLYGSEAIFGTPENFQQYAIPTLLRDNAKCLRAMPRLILLGIGAFGEDTRQTHALLQELAIPHGYVDRPQRKHDWHSGWVGDAVLRLLALDPRLPSAE